MLFDMDGTLTAPFLDFDQIKQEMGIGNQPILETLASLSGAKRQAAEEVLHRHELRCAEECELNSGCEELLRWLESRGVKLAVVTRNSRANAATTFARHNIEIDTLITRDDGVFKPAPDPLLLACKLLGVQTKDAWMVGDGSYDVQAGHAAGMLTVWISHGEERSFSPAPDVEVRDLIELHNLLRQSVS
jgi:HAD superfamily hydrolase (TIGR01509 family)